MKKFAIIISVAAFAYIVAMVVTCNRISNAVDETAKEHPITYPAGVDTSFSGLFNAKENISDAETTIVKGRNPVSDFTYGNDHFIEISRLNCSADGPLDSLISVSFKDTRMSQNVIYTGTSSRLPVESLFAHRNQESSAHVYVTIFGDGLSQISKNDSTLIYQGKLKKFGLKYFKDSTQDIYIRREKAPYQPVRIIFARRNNSTYLVLMAKASKGRGYESAIDEHILK
ncbi:hypothetical protein [Mucilaginibacter pedocola]|uniref:Uncharacterized protein n=1 Tax=Mucilaginibacter pedocola TaxID=1792845 RepID=A0A1S9PJL1_9SPHI|nr:hypothetical protein [Mucilaginibacter pedocola]OOQ61134.1 hypothetical protein BC343_22085 [Mucilaginibacter pedocola]